MLAELSAAFSGPEAIVQLITLVFLEIILGIDNIVFISITSDRLPKEKQHIGRRLGLAAAMCTRIALLFTLGWIMHLTHPLFSFSIGSFVVDVTGKNIILLAGGIYLIYKGITELKDMLELTEERERYAHPDHKPKPPLTLPRAVATIAVMDIVFSLDSVITAVGLVDHVIIAAIAIIIAIIFMMSLADIVSDFINKNPEVKLLALFFILTIGILLVLEFFSREVDGQNYIGSFMLDQWYVYAAMFFTLLATIVQMVYKRRAEKQQDQEAQAKADKSKGGLSAFIQRQPELGLLAILYVIAAVILLVVYAVGVRFNPMFVVFPVVFSAIVAVLQRCYSKNLAQMHAEIAAHNAAVAAGDPEALAKEANRVTKAD